MSLLEDDPPISHDGKAGWSTICRRGEHKTCAMAKAKCACPCHPTPRVQEKPMSEATVSTLPVSGRQDVTCECGYTAVSANGLAVHRGRAHGAKKHPAAAKAKKVVAPKPPAVEPVDQWQLLAAVAEAYANGLDCTIAEAIDGARTILDAITNAGWRIVEQP